MNSSLQWQLIVTPRNPSISCAHDTAHDICVPMRAEWGYSQRVVDLAEICAQRWVA